MSILDSILVSLFVITIVFVVLIALSFIVKIQSVFFGSILKKSVKKSDKVSINNNSEEDENTADLNDLELKLIDTDEKTAALIMAIVSNELKVPLSELQFKYIKALD